MEIQVLDSVIALVVVILLLSLIVQAIQGAFKKFLKIKSRTLEVSLIDLFENALDLPKKENQTAVSRCLENSPVLSLAVRKPVAKQARPEVRALLDEVRKEFEGIGRVAQSGRWAMDSLAKEDLLKVMARIAPDTLLPKLLDNLKAACQQVDAVQAALRQVGQSMAGAEVSGEASARFASLRQALVPLINDVRAIYNGKTQEFNAKLLIGDIVRLREVRLEEILAVLTETQKIVDRDLAAARTARQDTTVLAAASAALRDLAEKLADVHAGFDAALAPLRARLRSLENWFDTVMQSFEERYSRDMRTWALVISLIVVVIANANFFAIARDIWNDDARRARIVALGQDLELKRDRLQTAEQAAVPPQNLAALRKEYQDARKEITDLSGLYTSLGFEPIWKASPSKSPGGLLGMLCGWLVMTLVLSVGAPFWQDTLESLFGLKNLLRKRADIRPVEQASGGGYPRET